MTTRTDQHGAEAARRQAANQRQLAQEARERRSRLLRRAAVWAVGLTAAAAILTAMMLSASPESSTTAGPAPEFTLNDTAGATVSLADLRGGNVLLYFNEGAGCQSCLVQMAEIEKHTTTLAGLDLTVLPIVMNTREQISADMAVNNVKTPYLLDDGTVSAAYGTLGAGMHAGLPGHSFVLIDPQGTRLWYGAYPSMWLDPEELFDLVREHLEA